MAEQQVVIEKRHGVNIITINNPPANALSGKVLEDLDAAFVQAVADREIKCIIITGQGEKVFASGADIKELEGFDEAKAVEVLTRVKAFCSKILDCPKPTIAAINGIAFGGGLEMALCCDFRVAQKKAKFGVPEIRLAVIPASGGTQLLPRLIGTAKAKWLLLSGEGIESEEALKIGLIERITESDALMEETLEMGKRLAANGPLAYAAIKKAMKAGMEMPFSEAMKEETRLFADLCNTQDKAEGVRAFLEKRKPIYTGK